MCNENIRVTGIEYVNKIIGNVYKWMVNLK